MADCRLSRAALATGIGMGRPGTTGQRRTHTQGDRTDAEPHIRLTAPS
ncbi:hypothetical protein [Mycobacterium sp. shizuoka-1]|nr:hypothetical protein [Mycobacterium sp. shizuoka-1]